jgi:hypothetical protein
MPRFQYNKGFLFCRQCMTAFKEEDCPYYQAKVQKYKVCPSCPQKYKMRRKAHNKNSHEYYERVARPKFMAEKEIIIKWKWNNSRKQQNQ